MHDSKDAQKRTQIWSLQPIILNYF